MHLRPLSIAAIACVLASCWTLPEWHGTVHVKAMERAAIAKCGTGALTKDGAKRISRQPYLQSTTTTTTTVVWGSTEGKGEVVLREPGGAVVMSVTSEYAADPTRREQRLAAQHADGKDPAADNIYVMKSAFSGLTANHLYCYQLVANGVALTELAPLNTASAPHASDPLRFVALGDTGTGEEAQRAIAQQMSAVPFDLMLFLGDIAYDSGTPSELQNNFFDIYRDFLRYVPAYPAIGNHERLTRKGKPYFEAFVLPEPERYYSFDWGDVHFVAIDTTQRDSNQLAWLDADLGRNKLSWVIVYGHHPPYTNSLRGPQMWIREAFAQILTKHHVDLVLTGHEHQYERFKVAGVNYVVSGGGGGQLTKFWSASQALKQATVHHFLAFEVTASTLTMRAIDIEGHEIETLKLTKDSSGGVKTKVNDRPDEKTTPLPGEKATVPDEKIHDERDDDKEREHAPANTPTTPVVPTAGMPIPSPPPSAGSNAAPSTKPKPPGS